MGLELWLHNSRKNSVPTSGTITTLRCKQVLKETYIPIQMTSLFRGGPAYLCKTMLNHILPLLQQYGLPAVQTSHQLKKTLGTL